MKQNRLLRLIREFLAQNYDKRKGCVAIGCSGGVDSLTLLHLLNENRAYFSMELRVLHVDHGWRSNSREECDALKRHVEALGLSFHAHRLIDSPDDENIARQERWLFFQKIYKRYACQALVLAHQAEDQSETVLKRIFEGASIFSISGMRVVSEWEEGHIWRPLLGVQKEDLILWLKERGLISIDDPSNRDPKYLRARMRERMVPYLEAEFGKNFSSHLRRFGAEIDELSRYIERHCSKFEALVREVDRDVIVDFTSLYPFESVELKAFLKLLDRRYKLKMSRVSLDNLYELIEKNRAVTKKVPCSGGWVEVCRQSIAIKKNKEY